jgi:hypothetical protein
VKQTPQEALTVKKLITGAVDERPAITGHYWSGYKWNWIFFETKTNIMKSTKKLYSRHFLTI